MDLKECYTALGSDYEDILRRLMKEERIIRFLDKFVHDTSFSQLESAMERQDWESAFRCAHSLKGICMNLGLVPLQNAASKLTENLRVGSCDADTPVYFEELKTEYRKTVMIITAYLNT